MNIRKRSGIILLTFSWIGILFLNGCEESKNITFTTQNEHQDIEFWHSGEKLKSVVFTQEGDQFMEEKILKSLDQKYKIPSEDEEVAPLFFYTITSEATDQNLSYQGIIYVESGCGASREFVDFKLDSKSAQLEISRDHGIYITADVWLKNPPSLNIFQYVCDNN
jgi:hypothetical protein